MSACLSVREERVLHQALKILESATRREAPMRFDTDTAREYFRLRFAGLQREVFDVALLDTRLGLIHCERLHMGTIDRCEISAREVLRLVMQHNAANVVVAHNHPSGDPSPSPQDLAVTHRLHALLAMVDVELIDHIIVGGTTTESLYLRMLLTEASSKRVMQQARQSEAAKRAAAKRVSRK